VTELALKEHSGTFAEGLDRLERRSARRGRFSGGLERRPATPSKEHEGSFAEGLETQPHGLERQPKRRFSEGLEVDAGD
jgi:hypothetical protein